LINIKKADKAEIQELLTIYLEKVKWLRDNNKTMWDESQFTLESLKENYGNPEYFIGRINGKIVGGFILIEYDQRYWPEKKDDAFYFHKFIVKNEYCGKGYSDEMIRWVIKYSKNNKKKYVRLDYDGDRKYIKDLYTKNGFKPVETLSNEKGFKLIKAEYVIK